jgi:hypothetical protein
MYRIGALSVGKLVNFFISAKKFWIIRAKCLNDGFPADSRGKNKSKKKSETFFPSYKLASLKLLSKQIKKSRLDDDYEVKEEWKHRNFD